jgi:hypothetical protein
MNLFETPIAVVVRERSFLIELQNFITYCNDFYNIENGIYPIATSEEIEAAIGEYLTSPHEVDIQFYQHFFLTSFDKETCFATRSPRQVLSWLNWPSYQMTSLA